MNPQFEGIIFLSAIVLAAVLIALPLLLLRRRVIRSFVNRWVAENRFALIEYEERSFSPFTFSLKRSRGQEVVFAEIRDTEGNLKQCWLKLGGYGSGLFQYQVECKWVD